MEKNYNQSSSKKVHYRALSYFILGTQLSAYTCILFLRKSLILIINKSRKSPFLNADKTLSTENSMQISQKFNSNYSNSNSLTDYKSKHTYPLD